MNEEILLCECQSPDHLILIRWHDDDVIPHVYASIHLKKQPLFPRIWQGLKYILGYRSRYGEFDEFIFRPDDADKLQMVVDYLKEHQ